MPYSTTHIAVAGLQAALAVSTLCSAVHEMTYH